MGWLLVVAGIGPAVLLRVLDQANATHRVDAESESMAAVAWVLLELGWLVPGAILTVVGIVLIRRSRTPNRPRAS